MNMVQVYIKGQEDKELSSFLRYYPVRIKNIGMDAFFDRQVIYDFKDGRNHADVAKCVAKMLVKKFGRKVRSVVFSCVPASSQERNEARNKNFSELVCKVFRSNQRLFPCQGCWRTYRSSWHKGQEGRASKALEGKE